jgi:hypothetical protein
MTKRNILYRALDTLLDVVDENDHVKVSHTNIIVNYDHVKFELTGYNNETEELFIHVNLLTHDIFKHCIITRYEKGLFKSKQITDPTIDEKRFLKDVRLLFSIMIV